MNSLTTLRRVSSSALLAGLLAAAALPSVAQNAAPAAPVQQMQTEQSSAPAPQQRRMASPEQRQQREQARAQHQQKRLAALKDTLQLSASQQTAWEQFTQAMQATQHARLDGQGLEKLNTPERIDRIRALRQQHAAEADRRGDATKAFYAQLSDAQQKTFDAQRPQRGGHGMHAGMKSHGHHFGGR